MNKVSSSRPSEVQLVPRQTLKAMVVRPAQGRRAQLPMQRRSRHQRPRDNGRGLPLRSELRTERGGRSSLSRAVTAKPYIVYIYIYIIYTYNVYIVYIYIYTHCLYMYIHTHCLYMYIHTLFVYVYTYTVCTLCVRTDMYCDAMCTTNGLTDRNNWATQFQAPPGPSKSMQSPIHLESPCHG